MEVGIRSWLDPDTVEVILRDKTINYVKDWKLSVLTLQNYVLSSYFTPNLIEEPTFESDKLMALKENVRSGKIDIKMLNTKDSEMIRFHHLKAVKPELGNKRKRHFLSGWAAISNGMGYDSEIVAICMNDCKEDQNVQACMGKHCECGRQWAGPWGPSWLPRDHIGSKTLKIRRIFRTHAWCSRFTSVLTSWKR